MMMMMMMMGVLMLCYGFAACNWLWITKQKEDHPYPERIHTIHRPSTSPFRWPGCQSHPCGFDNTKLNMKPEPYGKGDGGASSKGFEFLLAMDDSKGWYSPEVFYMKAKHAHSWKMLKGNSLAKSSFYVIFRSRVSWVRWIDLQLQSDEALPLKDSLSMKDLKQLMLTRRLLDSEAYHNTLECLCWSKTFWM